MKIIDYVRLYDRVRLCENPKEEIKKDHSNWYRKIYSQSLKFWLQFEIVDGVLTQRVQTDDTLLLAYNHRIKVFYDTPRYELFVSINGQLHLVDHQYAKITPFKDLLIDYSMFYIA